MHRVGLHPDMRAFKEMYDEEKVAIIQNVGYPEYEPFPFQRKGCGLYGRR